MTESAAILHNATEKSLVLMDEVGRGTSTFDGLALARAIARHLVEKNKSLSLFATHYFEMTRLALEYKEVANVHLDAVEHKDTVVFLHAVEEGPASRSYGLQVAGLAGVPPGDPSGEEVSSSSWKTRAWRAATRRICSQQRSTKNPSPRLIRCARSCRR